LIDGVIDAGYALTASGSQVPYGVFSQTTMHYKAASTTTIYFNIAVSLVGSGTISVVTSGCFLKAMRMA
jgi:hypothetical protein